MALDTLVFEALTYFYIRLLLHSIRLRELREDLEDLECFLFFQYRAG